VSELLAGGSNVGYVVLNGEDIVLGRIPEKAFDLPKDTPVQEVMDPGPVTFRPGTPLEEIVERMKNARVDNVLVSTAEGKLVGILHLADAEREVFMSAAPRRRAE
jgi:CBS domain-containing protein